MKVLILSCKTGGGHDSAASAVAERLKQLRIPCEKVDFHTFISEKKSLRASRLYTQVTLICPKLFGAVYHIASWISHPGGHSPIYFFNKKYMEPMYRYIKENDFDTVITSHTFAAEALTYMRRKYPESKAIKTYLIATDYTCQPFQEETQPDYVFVSHKEIQKEFKGFRPEQLIPTGIPVSASFSADVSRSEARKTLALDPDKRSILVMTGSMGFGHSDRMLKKLLKFLPQDVQIIFLAGNNQKLIKRIHKQFPDENRVKAISFTDQVALYMKASDILFTKPGGLSVTEAAVSGIPLVITDYIPGCETKNAKFFIGHGMACHYKKVRSALPSLMRILDDPQKRESIIQTQREWIPSDATQKICEFMIQENRRK